MKKHYVCTDGNTAAAKMAYYMSDFAAIYPITPSSPMAETVDELRAKGVKNIFGNTVQVTELQSEAGAAGTLHGALAAGSLATTFTSSQGLLLMIPNMYKIAGELLPCVIHVAARTIATHALSIFGDHSDVMAARSTGFAMLASSSVQEAQDLALASHLATLEARVPFMHFFDGFRTSHEINKIEEISKEQVESLVDFSSINAFRASGLSSDCPTARGTAQNPDVYFQNREACTPYFNDVPNILEHTFSKIAKATGRKYHCFDYEGATDATHVIVSMGSSNETLSETVKYLNKLGHKVGILKVRLFRPFSKELFFKFLPKTVEALTVLDRTKESGAIGDPLYLEVLAAANESGKSLKIYAGRYGLSSKEFNPSMVLTIFKNMQSKKPKNHFTIGINDDVSNTSLKITKTINTLPKGTVECKFFGIGSDGTVSANKSSIKIIGDIPGMYAQGYFEYDSKKSGGLTISHLRFGKSNIQATYLSTEADFIACHKATYIKRFDVLDGIKRNGTFLLNSEWTDKELEKELPATLKRTLAQKSISFYIIDANEIARSVGMPQRINLIMQTSFFQLSKILPMAKSVSLIKEFAKKSYAKKGDKVLSQNMEAIDKSLGMIRKVNIPASWASENVNKKEEISSTNPAITPFYGEIIDPINQQKGNNLPVSVFLPNGEVPTGTADLEKRNIATILPKWIPEHCIQCNQCSLICPHGCIRPYLLKNTSALAKKTGAMKTIGDPSTAYKMQLSPMDCTGCGNCAHVCPSRQKALVMVEADEIWEKERKNYELLKNHENPSFENVNVKTSQYKKPLFEFSGACAGCGETPYIKLLTQLFGEKLNIANATGCSSIYGGSYPICPYTKTKDNKGPAWANSLFEDNAEFGLGLLYAHKAQTEVLERAIEEKTRNAKISSKLKTALVSWRAGERTVSRQNEIISLAQKELGKDLNHEDQNFLTSLIAAGSALTEKSFWVIGGDGWAYDIGFGGLDHVLSLNEKIRILVLDTELYSNTGGQSSKSTPLGMLAKFAASGKKTHKKELGLIATNYPNCYVAQVSFGANMNQTITAFKEAEEHNGPSLILAYAPCISHGIDMSKTPEQQKLATTSGYFPLFRHNPNKKPSLTLDPPFVSTGFSDFLKTGARYLSLSKDDPKTAARLFEEAENYALARIEKLKKMAEDK